MYSTLKRVVIRTALSPWVRLSL